MTALAVAPTLFDDLGGEPTLDDVLVDVWEGLTAHRVVSCPVCGEHMKPEYGAHALQPDDSGAAQVVEAGRRAGRMPEGGGCTSCGSTIS